MNSNRWLVLALLVSLAVNLLIAGIFIGRKLEGPPGRIQLDWLMQELDTTTRDRLRGNLRDQMDSSRKERHLLRETQRDLHQSILTEPFDEQKVRDAMAEVRAASARLQQKMHDQMIKNLGELSAEERLRVFKVLSNMEHRRHRPPRPEPGRTQEGR